MAFNVKYRVTHKTTVNGKYEDTHVIEILEDGFSGTVTNLRGAKQDGVAKLVYEDLDPKDLYSAPVQKGRLELYLLVRGQGTDSELGYDGLGILNEIFNADENQFQMRYKLNGSVKWTGYVLPDLLEYPEGEYVYAGKIVAKDLTRLQGILYPIQADVEKVIETIADLLDDLNLGLDIYTYTSWINQQTNDNDDYLNQIYNSQEPLRIIGRTSNEEDEQIDQEEALAKVLSNHGLILRQVDNAWRVYQLTAFEDATNVLEFQYDSTGTQIATGSVNLRQEIDRDQLYLTPSNNQINTGLKKIVSKFEHRTAVSGLSIPEDFQIINSGSATDTQFIQSKTFSDFFQSDGSQRLVFDTFARIDLKDKSIDPKFDLEIEAGGFWYNITETEWTGSQYINTFNFELRDENNTYKLWDKFVSIDPPTDVTVPVGADGIIAITYNIATDQTGSNIASAPTRYERNEIVVENESGIANSTFIEYQLIQTGSFSKTYELGEMWYGDGPASFAKSALRYAPSPTASISIDEWQRRGSGSDYRNFFLNLTKESMDIQRSSVRNLDGNVIGAYSPKNALGYESQSLFFLGGELEIAEQEWQGIFMDIRVQAVAPGEDNFDTIERYSDTLGSSGGGSSTTSGNTTTVSGITLTQGDERYLNESANGADINDASVFRNNIDVYSTSESEARYVNESGDSMSGLLTLNDNLLIDGYADLNEITTPANPPVGTHRIYAFNNAGFSVLHHVNSSGVDFEIGRDAVHIGRNQTGATITKGTPVYINGSNGNYPSVAPADSTSSGSMPLFGIAVQDISDNSYGEILTAGDLSGVDMSAYTDGDELYVAPGGGITNIKPTGDDLPQILGTVIKNTVSGIIEIERGDLYNFRQPDLNAAFNSASFASNVQIGGYLDLNGGKIIDLQEIEGRGDDKIEIYNNDNATNSRTYLELYGGETGLEGEAHFGGNSIHIYTGVTTLDTGSNWITFNSDGSATFQQDIDFYTNITSDDYISGILGAGAVLDNDAPNGSFFEIDNIRVRDSLRTHIFKKDIVRASNALLYITDASEIADEVTTPGTVSTSFVFTVKEAVFGTGDTIEYKDADEVTGTINSVVASVTDNGTSRTIDGKTVYDYSASLDSGTNVTLRAGDTVVRTSGGNVLIDASTEFSPFIDVLNAGNVKARLGNLNGVSDTINGQSVSGYGLYSDNAFLKGGIVATYGAIGGFDISADAISGANFFLSGSATGNEQFINANDAFIVRGNGDVTGSSVLFDGGLIGGWTLSSTTISGGNLVLDSSGQIRNTTQINSENAYQLNNDGSGWFAGRNLEWDASGNLSLTGEITASSLDIATNFTLGNTMTLDTGGEITNTGGDFRLDNLGLTLAEGVTFGRRITWENLIGTPTADIYTNSEIMVMEASASIRIEPYIGASKQFIFDDERLAMPDETPIRLTRVNNTTRDNIDPQEGDLIYNTDGDIVQVRRANDWATI